MSRKITFSQSVNMMKTGSMKGFSSFYQSSVQYVYQLSCHLFRDREKALLFMEDFYPYLYLHIDQYKGKGDEKQWINRQITERYRQLSIGRSMPPIEALVSETASVALEKREARALYERIVSKIHFPPEASTGSLVGVVLLILLAAGIAVLAVLVFGRMRAEGTTDGAILNSGTQEQEADGTETQVIDIPHNEETDGATTYITLEEPEEPDTPEAASPDVQTPRVQEPAAPQVPQISEPEVTQPQVQMPQAHSEDAERANQSVSDAQSAIDDFLSEVEDFQNYDITSD